MELSKAIKMLKAAQTWLGASRYSCDEDERLTWDSIDEAIAECESLTIKLRTMEKAIKAVTQYRSHCTSGDDVRCLVPIRFINELAALEGEQE